MEDDLSKWWIAYDSWKWDLDHLTRVPVELNQGIEDAWIIPLSLCTN